jgi:hypothetical protein
MHRADRIANRLHDMWKGTMKTRWEFPPKPSRMRWKTYRRLKQQCAPRICANDPKNGS